MDGAASWNSAGALDAAMEIGTEDSATAEDPKATKGWMDPSNLSLQQRNSVNGRRPSTGDDSHHRIVCCYLPLLLLVVARKERKIQEDAAKA